MRNQNCENKVVDLNFKNCGYKYQLYRRSTFVSGQLLWWNDINRIIKMVMIRTLIIAIQMAIIMMIRRI